MATLKDLKSETFEFKVKRLFSMVCVEKGIIMSPERIHVSVIECAIYDRIRLLLDIATQEELIAEAPATWWDAFKEQHFPRWLLRRFPANHVWYTAVHKFPELNLPENVLGKEFVTLKVIKYDEFEKLKERNEL